MTTANKVSHSPSDVYIYIVVVAMMATIFGFNLGSMLSSKARLINVFMLEIYSLDSILSTFLIGSLVGIFLGGRLAFDAGRVQPLLGSFGIGVLGQCASILAPTFSTLFISEFAVGVSFGVYLLTSICYINEISFTNTRGKCACLIGTFLTLGVFNSILLKDIIPNNLIISSIITLCLSAYLLIFSYVKLPESPRWLALTDASYKALNILIRLRGSNAEAARELAAINESVLGEDRGLSLFFRNSVYRTLIWLMLFVVLSAHLAGMSILPYESMKLVRIYNAAVGQSAYYGANEINYPLLVMELIASVVGNLITFFLVDKIGRVKLLIATSFANIFAIVILYIFNFALLSSLGTFAVSLAITLYIFSSIVFANVFLFVLLPELLPAKGRELGLTIILIANVALLMIGIYFFDNALRGIGILKVLGVFLFSTCVMLTLIYKLLPETSLHLLEAIENEIFNTRSIKSLKSKIGK
ncbi:MAG: MFS transporter [Succinivibrio sp.]|nr:MFS transporter [Succinivibrio sp.]